MSAIITQLTYNINEKLHLDDHTFTFQQRNKSESQTSSANNPTSLSPKEPSAQWMPPPAVGSLPFLSTNPTTYTSSANSDKRFLNSTGAVLGLASQRFPQPQASGFPRRDRKQFGQTLVKDDGVTKTSLFDLQESSAPKYSRGTQADKMHASNNITRLVSSITEDADKHISMYNLAPQNSLPSIPVVGHSCTLHSPKKLSETSAVASADIPATKRHCRSVSEPNDLVDIYSASTKLCQSTSPIKHLWKPGIQSKVWVPIRRLRKSTRRAFSASTPSGFKKPLTGCSWSLDCGSVHSGHSTDGGSLLTPPVSPVPRPASVTVIKQEGGAWTFLSSQHTLSRCFQQSSFSPLPSPTNDNVLPLSSRSREAGSRSWCHTGLSATKRSLSFSDDFEHRESIQYTPISTPELEGRFDRQTSRYGGLSRCQSHPSDLNMRKMKGRRRNSSRTSHNRPMLDFAKMKQTSFSKRNRCRDRNYSGSQPFSCTSSLPSVPGESGLSPTVMPVFPSIISPGTPNKSLAIPQPLPSVSPPAVLFTVGCSKPLTNIRTRIPSSADEVPLSTEPECNNEVATTSGGVASSFIRECGDLDINAIENETDDEAT